MNPETYDQVAVSKDVDRRRGALPAGRHERDRCPSMTASAIAIELPQRVTFEVVETEPATKGQTASSSYKPAHPVERRRAPWCRRTSPSAPASSS